MGGLRDAARRERLRRRLSRGVEEKIEPGPSTYRRSVDRFDWSLWGGHPTTVEVLERRGDPGDPLAGVPADKANEFIAALASYPGTYLVQVDEAGRVVSKRRRPSYQAEEEDDVEQG
jgi:hypothetical protein